MRHTTTEHRNSGVGGWGQKNIQKREERERKRQKVRKRGKERRKIEKEIENWSKKKGLKVIIIFY